MDSKQYTLTWPLINKQLSQTTSKNIAANKAVNRGKKNLLNLIFCVLGILQYWKVLVSVMLSVPVFRVVSNMGHTLPSLQEIRGFQQLHGDL